MTYLPVEKDGLINLNQLQDAIRPDTAIVSVMAVNNEIGTLTHTHTHMHTHAHSVHKRQASARAHTRACWRTHRHMSLQAKAGWVSMYGLLCVCVRRCHSAIEGDWCHVS